MTWTHRSRALLVLLVTGLTVGAPGVETLARSRRPPVVEAPPPPPPTPAGPVGLPDALIAEAAAYEAYLQRITATSPAFTDGASVSSALKTAAAYDPKALIRGAVAFGAVAALQSPTFVADVRAAGNSPENRRLMVGYILANPAYVFVFKGSDVAAGLARRALGDAGLHLLVTGKAVKQAAYDVQHQAWSKGEIADRAGRLAAVEAPVASPVAASAERVAALRLAASGAGPLPIDATAVQPPYTPLVARALQLAAIAALGEAGDSATDRLATLMSEGGVDTCLHIARLNLYQCLAVAKPHYEDIFCMGQHILADTGSCLARNAGMDLPVDAVPLKAGAPAAARRSKHSRPG